MASDLTPDSKQLQPHSHSATKGEIVVGVAKTPVSDSVANVGSSEGVNLHKLDHKSFEIADSAGVEVGDRAGHHQGISVESDIEIKNKGGLEEGIENMETKTRPNGEDSDILLEVESAEEDEEGKSGRIDDKEKWYKASEQPKSQHQQPARRLAEPTLVIPDLRALANRLSIRFGRNFKFQGGPGHQDGVFSFVLMVSLQ
ncbi:unnamed protein product [Protopolystoma xenopodis]|uniref:Uncharacterized protein n=1 Tax=Protopolystoma xenopodis TaxID=117903 RepID=A0A448XCF7_9PLAT|nr:unnamed protein product [Protopolystoma xenopodis]